MRDGIQYFRSPSQVIEQSPLPTELFRIGGLVKDESWIKGKKHQFVVTDTENDIPVEKLLTFLIFVPEKQRVLLRKVLFKAVLE